MNSCAVLSTIIFAAVVGGAASAQAEEPDIDGQAGSDVYEIIGEQANAAESLTPDPVTDQGGGDVETPAIVGYRWIVVCAGPGDAGDMATQSDCGAARVCANPRERLYRLWGRTDDPPAWLPLGTRCFGERPTAADTPRPTVTPGLVLNEIRRIGLPMLEARTQPESKTLVNFATIFYTEANPFATTVTLLGQNVAIEAVPSQYTWHYGDGSSSTTTSPGAPYPAKDITYSYSDAHVTVRPRVDVTYTARFRVNGGAWQDIDETVTIAGPEGSLRVSEATPVLSGDYS
jgi:hypothetical protein